MIRFAFAAGLLAACFFSGAAPLLAQDEPQTFRVVAWNLEHFVDPYDNPYIDSGQENQGQVKSEAVLEQMALALQQMDADVVALQEVEDDRAVKLFIDTYLPDAGYKYYATLPSITWYQNVVIASRFPIGAITSLREVEMYNEVLGRRENKYNSRLLGAEIMVNDNYTFTMWNVHLKAGGDPEDPVWRTEQIRLLGRYLDEDDNTVILGDFNLVPESPEYQLLRGDLELQDPAEVYDFPPTHPSDNPRRRIDHILVNDEMAPEYVEGSLSVGGGVPYKDLARISDHLPVMAAFVAEER